MPPPNVRCGPSVNGAPAGLTTNTDTAALIADPSGPKSRFRSSPACALLEAPLPEAASGVVYSSLLCG